jgi:hypothetical protein
VIFHHHHQLESKLSERCINGTLGENGRSRWWGDVDFATAKLHVWRTKGGPTNVRVQWRPLERLELRPLPAGDARNGPVPMLDYFLVDCARRAARHNPPDQALSEGRAAAGLCNGCVDAATVSSGEDRPLG